MVSATVPPPDSLILIADATVQREAARLAQDVFSSVFRLAVNDGGVQSDEARLAGLGATLQDWVNQAEGKTARALRLALLLNGLDQWGIAWSGAFELQAIPGLSSLMGRLRTALSPEEEAVFIQQFETVSAVESDAADFKIALRREIHLALWHAMAAADAREEALQLATYLGSVFFSLISTQPATGWRLVADALAHIQIRCLSQGLATEGVAQEATESLFAALSRQLPARQRDLVMAHATQAVLAWRQAQKPH